MKEDAKQKTTIDTWVVIPNWNGADFIARALESLQTQTYPHQVAVVDNGSSDESVSLIQKGFPETIIIKLPVNRGFTGGVNIGIQRALKEGARYIALFNNDAIADSQWLEELIAVMKRNPRCGISTGKLLSIDRKRLDSAGDAYSIWGLPFPRGRGKTDTGQYDRSEQIFAASGGATLYRRKFLEEVGLFDEDFFAYFEDIDLSFRAQLSGWHIWYTPSAVAYHHIHGTSSRLRGFTHYHSLKNMAFVYLKNMPGWLFWKYLPRFTLVYGLSLIGLMRRQSLWLGIKALVITILLTPKKLIERYAIQRRRQVSTAAIDTLLDHEPIELPSRMFNRLLDHLGRIKL